MSDQTDLRLTIAAVLANRTSKPTATRRAIARDWKCMECGKTMTLAQASRAMSIGCSKCGGSDVDLAR